MAAKTINEQLRDRMLLRAVRLHWYANSEVRAMLRILAEADSALVVRLAAALERLPPGAFQVRRLDALLSGVWDLNDQMYRQLAMRTAREMEQLAGVELEAHRATFEELLPRGQVQVGVPGARRVWAAAEARPFRGRLLSGWFDHLASATRDRVVVSIRTGFVQGLTVDEMIRDIRGTRAQKYADGILQISRRHAEAVVRTAVSHTAAVARGAFYAENQKLIKAEQWLSTLDTRTTDVCIARDGKRYSFPDHEPMGHGLAWLEGPGAIHWGCRSVSTPVINSAELLGIELPPTERAALNGVAAPGTTYKEWLRTQSKDVQDKALGARRGAMYRAGTVKFEAFFNNKGALLRLDQL